MDFGLTLLWILYRVQYPGLLDSSHIFGPMTLLKNWQLPTAAAKLVFLCGVSRVLALIFHFMVFFNSCISIISSAYDHPTFLSRAPVITLLSIGSQKRAFIFHFHFKIEEQQLVSISKLHVKLDPHGPSAKCTHS